MSRASECGRNSASTLRSAAKVRKIELPKGDAFADLVAKYIAKNGETLREQAEESLAAKVEQAKMAADMAGDILSGL